MRFRHALLPTAAAAAAVLAAPSAASACGGFFCNSAPMDQAGENIAFAVEEDGTIEAHVQIVYQGSSEDFAWILPVPSTPELGVGTDALFRQLGQRTRPRFQLDYETEGSCREEPTCASDRLESAPGGAVDAGAGRADGGGGDVTVRLREAVGPYDAVVLEADSADVLRTWLDDNGYDIPDAAGELLGTYVEEGHQFVALKLQQYRETGEIQPIVLRFTERQPCIPIRLTSIATVPGMPITTYVLGKGRAFPLNYAPVEPDLTDPELWLSGAYTGGPGGPGGPVAPGRPGGGTPAAYQEAVDDAIDEAGGQAFVTEYAGDVPEVSLELAEVEDLREETDPEAFLMELQARGFTGDTQLLAILQRHLPPPEGVDPQTFYNCLTREWCEEYGTYLAELDFDPSALVDALQEAIVQPRADAQAMLGRHAELTRMYTKMDAEDMTMDPIFDIDERLPEVSNVHQATLVTECSSDYFRWSAPKRIELPDGDAVRVDEGIRYTGTDEQYCDDYEDGEFAPWTPRAEAEATAARREAQSTGRCSVGPAGAGAFASGGLVALALAAVFARRRRRR